MEKEVTLASTLSKLELGNERDNVLEDRINQLPDELLVSILSLLNITEAARTSVLSHRWERLWTFYNGSLNFDATETLFSLLESNALEQERHKYVTWVNQVMTSLYESSVHDEFRICFDLDKDHSRHIDRWIEFAMEKRVQRLQFDFAPVVPGSGHRDMRYTFSLDCYARLKQPSGLYSISSITSLCLKFLNVSGEVIEHFLYNCPLLERLCVAASELLLNLKVTGAALQLKYLDISHCRNLESVEISAPNLVSLNYFGRERIKLHLENVPRLVEVSLGCGLRCSVTYMIWFFYSYLSQLETFMLDINTEAEKEFTQLLPFLKLKHLILNVYAPFEESLLGWTSLMKASRLLQKLTLQFLFLKPMKTRRNMQKVAKFSHEKLKVVELVGFVGCATDLELVMYLLENASSLEKIVIKCCHPHIIGTPWEFQETKKETEARKHAMELKMQLPRRVQLVII